MGGIAEGAGVTGEAVTGTGIAIDGEVEGDLDDAMDGIALQKMLL